MDKIVSMRIFSRVAEAGNFSTVAKHMECSPGNISRAIVALEDELHTRLLQRTTRRVALTESGERYYHRCKKILAEIDHADAEASESRTLPRGKLRVHAVSDIGLKQLTSTIVEYRRAFPAVSVELMLMQRMPNLIEEELDVSIVAAASLPDSGNVSRIIGKCQRMLVATPAYLSQHPIESADDLLKHALVQISAPFDHPGGWPPDLARLPAHGEQPAGQLLVNDAEAMRLALLADAGVGALPAHLAIDDIKAGSLVQVFPEYRLQSANVFVVFPSRRYLDAKIKTFVGFLTDSLREKLALQIDSLATVSSPGVLCYA